MAARAWNGVHGSTRIEIDKICPSFDPSWSGWQVQAPRLCLVSRPWQIGRSESTELHALALAKLRKPFKEQRLVVDLAVLLELKLTLCLATIETATR
mmetsp:Transcript_72041/g.150525  ORF Transcript_72041/g.150525 Transcript_72041/m.150525 type:complete len:97 (-) Transcript_72041:1052-1342(-)